MLVTSRVTIYELLKRRTPQPGEVGGGEVRALDLRPTEGGETRAIVTHLGPTADGGGGARDSNTPQTYDQRADLRPAGVSQKGGQIRVWLDAAPDAGQGFEKPDSPA